MTSGALSIVEFIFTRIWGLFVSFNIPGTNVTPAAFALFLLAASFGLRFFLSWSKSLPSASDASKSFRSARSSVSKVDKDK